MHPTSKPIKTYYPTMMGSIRLFFASLFITQLSGVIGSRSDNSNNQKDQLRGKVRAKNRNMNGEGSHDSRINEASAIRKDQINMAEIERDLQKVTTDDYSQLSKFTSTQKEKVIVI